MTGRKEEESQRKEVLEITFGVSAFSFLRAVREVSFAASSNRLFLNGVLFELDGNSLTLVAADGYRMSVSKIETDVPLDTQGRFLPNAAILEESCRVLFPRLTKAKGIKECTVELDFTPTGLEIKSSDSDREEFIPQIKPVIDGEGGFPDWKKYFPEPTTGVVFQRPHFLAVLEFFDKEATLIIESLEGEEKLRLRQGSSKKRERLLSVEGSLLNRVALQRRFLVDLLTHAIYTQELRMEVTSSYEGVVFRRPEDDDFLHLIMPMKTINPLE